MRGEVAALPSWSARYRLESALGRLRQSASGQAGTRGAASRGGMPRLPAGRAGPRRAEAMCRQDSRCIRDFLPEPANRVPLVVPEAERVLGAERVRAPDAAEVHRDVDFAEVPDGGKLSATQVVRRVLLVGDDALVAAGAALPLDRRSRVGGAYHDHPAGAGAVRWLAPAGSALSRGSPASHAFVARTTSPRCPARRQGGPGASSGRPRKWLRSVTIMLRAVSAMRTVVGFCGSPPRRDPCGGKWQRPWPSKERQFLFPGSLTDRSHKAGRRTRLAKVLDGTRAPVAVSTQLSIPARDVRLTVAGAGPMRFPVMAAQAKRMIASAQPARFGRG